MLSLHSNETGETWKEEVPGRAYGLSIIGGKLVVSQIWYNFMFRSEKIKRQILREHPPRINQPPLEQVSAAKEALTSLQGYALVLALPAHKHNNLANSTQFHAWPLFLYVWQQSFGVNLTNSYYTALALLA